MFPAVERNNFILHVITFTIKIRFYDESFFMKEFSFLIKVSKSSKKFMKNLTTFSDALNKFDWGKLFILKLLKRLKSLPLAASSVKHYNERVYRKLSAG